jgi:uncharacterized MnhB-related membrane protein
MIAQTRPIVTYIAYIVTINIACLAVQHNGCLSVVIHRVFSSVVVGLRFTSLLTNIYIAFLFLLFLFIFEIK